MSGFGIDPKQAETLGEEALREMKRHEYRIRSVRYENYEKLFIKQDDPTWVRNIKMQADRHVNNSTLEQLFSPSRQRLLRERGA